MWTQAIYQNPSQTNPFHSISTTPNVLILDNEGNILVQASHKHSTVGNTNNSMCSTFSGIPRSTDVIFKVNNVEYPVTTSEHQQNFIISGKLINTSTSNISCPFDVNSVCGTVTGYTDTLFSNIGVGSPQWNIVNQVNFW